MKKCLSAKAIVSTILALPMIFATGTALAAAKSYQVTGPVTAIDDASITVQKGKESWTIEKDAAGAATEVKKGDKVTISYRMVATKIDAKPAKK